MKIQPKTRLTACGAVLAGLMPLGGCSSSHPSAAWQGPGMYAGSAGSSSSLVFTPGRANTGTLVYLDSQGPEFSRLDHTMSVRDLSRRDELFGVRAERHPSLSNQRTFRGTRRAGDYTYPTSERRGYRGYRSYYRD